MIREFLFPMQWTYQGLTGFRNICYDIGLLRAHNVEAKVISIGNLTVGGTGKTPMTMALIDLLKARKSTCGVVSRGYKRAQAGVHEVDTSVKASQLFGDEPALIKANYPDVPVFVGEKRIAAAKALLAQTPVDFIICDDAFQHRSIKRDLNILLFDATENQKNYRVLPVGMGREPVGRALKRADILIITKANLAGEEKAAEVKGWLQTKCDKPIVIADYDILGFRSLDGKFSEQMKDKVYLVSAIAKPEALEKALAGRAQFVKHKIFKDHFKYTDLEIESILDETSQLQARWVLTTPKDAIKMKAFPRLRERLWVAELGLKLRDGKKELNEAIDRLARSSS